jgi:DNA-directed RNA polymerase specialized sigma24 family protein
MNEHARNQGRTSQPSSYATREDFVEVFDEDVSGLCQLSFLLTGDHQKAEKCFVAGIEDCAKENHGFRVWARSWAKRVIVENAIVQLKPRPSLPNSSSDATVFPENDESRGSRGHFDVDAVLGLGDFERFVFVMSVLEHYSNHECALLLGCSVLQIREGRVRALEQLAGSGQAVSVAL